MTPSRNRQVLLARRPQGAVTPADFEIVDGTVPTPGDGQLLLRNIFLSIDPYLRGRMDESKDGYAQGAGARGHRCRAETSTGSADAGVERPKLWQDAG